MNRLEGGGEGGGGILDPEVDFYLETIICYPMIIELP